MTIIAIVREHYADLTTAETFGLTFLSLLFVGSLTVPWLL